MENFGLTSMRRRIISFGTKTVEIYMLTFGKALFGFIPEFALSASGWYEDQVVADLRKLMESAGHIGAGSKQKEEKTDERTGDGQVPEAGLGNSEPGLLADFERSQVSRKRGRRGAGHEDAPRLFGEEGSEGGS